MRETDERQARQLERYLLGDLPDREIHRIESRLLEHPDLFTQVETIEDDLIDRYVRDELSDDDRRRFDDHLLPAARVRRRVAFARSLHRLTEDSVTATAFEAAPDDHEVGITPFRRPRESRRPLSTRLAWAACLVAVIGAGALALVTLRLQSDLRRAVHEQQAAAARATSAEQRVVSLNDAMASARAGEAMRESLQHELTASRDRIAALEQRTEELQLAARRAASRPATSEASALPKVLFLAFGTRGNERPPTLELPAPHGAELQLDLDRLHPTGTLTVTIRRAGTQIWKESGLSPVVSDPDAMLPVTLPEQLLLPGTYRIEIRETDREDVAPIAAYDLVVAH